MEYGRLKPIPGVSSKETTAVTMKSIQQLLEEEMAARARGETTFRGPLPEPAAQPPASAKPAPIQQPPHLQQPPHMVNAAPAPVRQTDAPAEADEAAAAPADEPKSFIRRFLGR